MNRHASIILALPTTLLLFHTATAEEIISAKPTPSRAEWAPLSYEIGSYTLSSGVMLLMSLMPQANGQPPYSICDSYTFRH